LLKKKKKENNKDKNILHNSLGIFLYYNYPIFNFENIVNPGFGFDIEYLAFGFFLNNVTTGITLGYDRFSGKENSEDLLSLAYILFHCGYNWNIYNIICTNYNKKQHVL
jgi:hypothetical protein